MKNTHSLAVIFTMYDEHYLVLRSLKNIFEHYGTSCYCIVAHSNDLKETAELAEIKKIANKYLMFDDLSKTVESQKLPAHAVCRNLSAGFDLLYSSGVNPELIVGLTGDTLVTDSRNFRSLQFKMKEKGWLAMVSQAIGARFHNQNPVTKVIMIEDRLQDELTTDFACCLFVLDGEFSVSTSVFKTISLTNEFTSEQCLGDELVRAAGFNSKIDFHKKVGRLNSDNIGHSYAYNDGIRYHARTDGRPGR